MTDLTDRFAICLHATLAWEGGWDDDPVDPEHGWQVATAAANANTAMTVTRPLDALHPNDQAGQVGGYEQMGDAAYACINWLVATGKV